MSSQSTWEPEVTAQRPVRVVLDGFADTFRVGLAGLLALEEGVDVVRAGLRAVDVERCLATAEADVAVLGEAYARSPELLEQLLSSRDGVGIVVLADDLSPGLRMRLLSVGCLPTDVRGSELADAVRRSSEGQSVHLIRPRDRASLRAVARLTQREWDVLVRKERGASNAQIAAALHVTVNTVRSHVNHIYEKLGVTSRSELFALKLSDGWHR